jgi:hypothetical protein
MLSAKDGRLRVLSILFAAGCVLALGAAPSLAEQLQTKTVDAFERYVRLAEARDERDLATRNSFLSIDALPQANRAQAYAELDRGIVITEQCPGCAVDYSDIPGGLVHDWTGVIFIPGVSVRQTIALLQDYDRDADYYRPQVVESRLLSHSGDTFHVFLRLKQTQAITVVLDTEYEVRYTALDATHAYSRSYSTRISQVDNTGEQDERGRPVGDDDGFLWRLYSYWRF